jgi:hypothetical protein
MVAIISKNLLVGIIISKASSIGKYDEFNSAPFAGKLGPFGFWKSFSAVHIMALFIDTL